ncbi:MAG TPA: hypothetical protein VEX60_18460 [Pyrinomonadaceae bacterium]|nr:hypothetical protein [Pyrinomonadaceae bacterium]
MNLKSSKTLKVLASVCLLFALASAAFPQGRGRTWLRGTWEGTGYQIDDNSTWTMSLTASGRRYKIEYPSLNCGGEWRRLSIDSRRARFRERLNRGLDVCSNKGTVVVERLNATQVIFLYYRQGEKVVSSSAILDKKR